MKATIKKTLAIALALALTLSAIGCGVAYADAFRGEVKKAPVVAESAPTNIDIPTETKTPTASTPEMATTSAPTPTQPISKDKAEALARESLGITDLHLSSIELDDGKYELDFCDGSAEYDVDVHATSGKLLKSEVDYHDECDPCDKAQGGDRYDDLDDRYDDDWDDRYDDDDHDDDWDDRYDDLDDRYDDDDLDDDDDDHDDDWDDRYDD